MGERLRTLGVVSVITLLIWVFAEGESLRSLSVSVRARVESGSADLVVSLSDDEAWDGTIEVRIDGPTARLNAVRAELRRTEIVELTIREVGTDGGVIRLGEALRSHPIFRESGVSIVSTDPATISIDVDRLVRREARVVVDSGGVPVRGLAQPVPASVTLLVPERVNAGLGDQFVLTVRLHDDMVQGLAAGQAQTIFNIPVELPEGMEELAEVLGELPLVNVRLTLVARREAQTMATVPVVVSMPSVISDQYVVRLADEDQFLNSLELRGPVGIFERVGPGKQYTPRIDVFLMPDLLSAQVASDGSEVEVTVTGTLSGVPAGVELTQELGAIRVFVRRLGVEPIEAPDGEG